jgi:hypothetical protein
MEALRRLPQRPLGSGIESNQAGTILPSSGTSAGGRNRGKPAAAERFVERFDVLGCGMS